MAEPCGLHADSLADRCNLGTDRTDTDDSNFLTGKLNGFSGIADLPVPFSQFLIRFGKIFRRCKHQCDGVFGNGETVCTWSEDHRELFA